MGDDQYESNVQKDISVEQTYTWAYDFIFAFRTDKFLTRHCRKFMSDIIVPYKINVYYFFSPIPVALLIFYIFITHWTFFFTKKDKAYQDVSKKVEKQCISRYRFVFLRKKRCRHDNLWVFRIKVLGVKFIKLYEIKYFFASTHFFFMIIYYYYFYILDLSFRIIVVF